ncbi:MAG: hypothetical protein IJ339_02510 [Oscillospiraceae bacterium]|nr:hypothetical protein [Oscillospiraceae bacterium]
MKICKCSERPLGILDSKVVMAEDKPWQVLMFGCTNKQCSEYKKVVFEKHINLLDNTETKDIDL